MLEIQLVHSRSSREGNCPTFTPTPGVDALHQYAEKTVDELHNLGRVKHNLLVKCNVKYL